MQITVVLRNMQDPLLMKIRSVKAVWLIYNQFAFEVITKRSYVLERNGLRSSGYLQHLTFHIGFCC